MTDTKKEQYALHNVSKCLLKIMKDNATIKNNEVSSAVFSVFELECIMNDFITDYRVRKCMKELQENKLITKSKFFVDNESNLITWKWHITKLGFNAY